MRTSLCFAIFVLLTALGSPAFAQSSEDAFMRALTGHHLTVSLEGLEKLAGSRDAMVSRLLEIRRNERPAFCGIRAERFLLRLTSYPEVQQALEDDLRSEQYLGLARVIVTHLDKVAEPEVRTRLARAALDRAAREAPFATYARMLVDSKDPEVSRLAREALQ